MEIERISAFGIEGEVDKPQLPFSTYSKFKYGHKPSAMSIARAMTGAFLERYPISWLKENRDEIIVTTSPYWYAQPAAHSLATYFNTELNTELFREGGHPLKFVRIHRAAAPSCDFGKLTLEERERNMAQNVLSADASAFVGRNIILIEDSRITGSHEKKIIGFLESIGVKKVVFVYAVSVSNGQHDPQIENRMNHDVIVDLDSLLGIMSNHERYVLNSRACRFILERGENAEFNQFLARLSDSMLLDIFRYSINDGYGLNEKYRTGILKISAEIEKRGGHHNLREHPSEADALAILGQ